MPILLFGKAFWDRIVNFDAMVEEGVIAPRDRGLFRFVETAEEAVEAIRVFLAEEKRP
ncbi:MAG: LOG family protein, partial [Proteobacteria bacterium]|nr:LOG family protein [Pseudomonadota bacterium]